MIESRRATEISPDQIVTMAVDQIAQSLTTFLLPGLWHTRLLQSFAATIVDSIPPPKIWTICLTLGKEGRKGRPRIGQRLGAMF